MSIGITGQYYFQFNLGDNNDFIYEDDLLSFTLIEEAGNVLPTYELDFMTEDETVFPMLNEGTQLQVVFGKDQNSLTTIPLATMDLVSSPQGSSKQAMRAVGTLSAVPYLNQPRMNITAIQSGAESIIATAKRSFTLDPASNVTKTIDLQRWIQPFQSDRAFINKTWLHSYIPNSFLALGITSRNTFVIKDIKKDLLNPVKYNFTTNIVTDKDIYYDSDPVLKSRTGFINNWTGYGKSKMVYNLDEDTTTTIQVIPQPVMALTNALAKIDTITSKFDAVGVTNGNTHTNYWQAYLQNLTYLSSFGNINQNLSFTNQFIPIQILDQVNYRALAVDNGGLSAGRFTTGRYYVSKVSRTLSSKQFNTVVTLCRESLNNVTNQSA